MSAKTLERPCAHCGRLCGDYDGGYATVGDAQVCHPNAPDRPDCYSLVTVQKHQLRDCPKCTPMDPLLADAELLFFPAYTQPYFDPENLAQARFRRVVGDVIAATEARTWRKAIERLKDAAGRVDEIHTQTCSGATWHKCTDPNPEDVYLPAMVAYLEATEGDDHAS